MLLDVDLSAASVLFVGAGKIAGRRLERFDSKPTRIRVVAKEYSDEFLNALVGLYREELADHGVDSAVALGGLLELSNEKPSLRFDLGISRLEIFRRSYDERDLDGFGVVFVCSDDRELNRKVANAQKSHGLFVNNASDGKGGNLRTVASSVFANLEIGVLSFEGVPALSSWICQELAKNISDELDRFVGLCAQVRAEAKKSGKGPREGAWEAVLNSRALEYLGSGDNDLAIGEIRKCLS